MNNLGFEGINAETTQRKSFLFKTYLHVFLALVLFVCMQAVMFQTGVANVILQKMASVNWLLILMAFGILSSMASRMAYQVKTLAGQYMALVAFVFLWSVLSLSLVANFYYGSGVLVKNAAFLTIVSFSLLTVGTFVSKVNFSFLGVFLRWIGILAISLIVVQILGPMIFGGGFSFGLGTWFSLMMIAYAGGSILYSTSRIMRDFPVDKHVAASLELFSSIILLFWYIYRYIGRD